MRAICRTHEKSYLAEKVLFIEYSSFNPSFMFTSTTLNNAVYVNSVLQALFTTARRPPNTEDRFCQVFLCRFSVSVFFSEPPKSVLYTILNVKFISFV